MRKKYIPDFGLITLPNTVVKTDTAPPALLSQNPTLYGKNNSRKKMGYTKPIISIKKKFGTAVQRNRQKRIIREAWRAAAKSVLKSGTASTGEKTAGIKIIVDIKAKIRDFKTIKKLLEQALVELVN